MRNLEGLVFGYLTAVKQAGRDRFGRIKWECLCRCGKTSTVQSGNLISGTTKSCGCKLNELSCNFKDERGRRYGKLIVGELIRKDSKSYYKCLCDCGREKIVWSSYLRTGKVKSCGCLNRSTGDRNISKRGSRHKKWAIKILEINGRMCEKCGETKKKLHAHHVDSYARNPSKRYRIDNGIPLCFECHKKYHSLYGIEAKRKDFHEWIGAPYDDFLSD
jgi:hypothetical protein